MDRLPINLGKELRHIFILKHFQVELIQDMSQLRPIKAYDWNSGRFRNESLPGESTMHLPCVAISVCHGTCDVVEKMFLDTGSSCRIRPIFYRHKSEENRERWEMAAKNIVD